METRPHQHIKEKPCQPIKGGDIFLAGDIGGTNTRLAVFSKEKGPHHPLFQEAFHSRDYNGLEEIVKKFLLNCNLEVEAAIFGVAGPVKDGRSTITNLPWIIEEKILSLELNIKRVHLMNDLEAIASAIPFLDKDDLESINAGHPVPNGTIALIAPGTGLGEAFLTWDGAKYRVHASEGGHANFAPSDQLESDLLNYMRKQYKHVSYERVCSGIGIPNIYNFFKDTGRFEEPYWLAQKLKIAEDPAPVIFNSAVDSNQNSAICIAVVEMFISILGTEAGNLALKVLSDGGLYLGGGIPSRITAMLKKGHFMESLSNKGRFSTFLANMPVNIIRHPNGALLGAACQGLYL